MSDLSTVLRLLDTDPQDSGCEEAMELLHVYAELLARDEDAARLHPRIAAHLRACGPCREDLQGLLAAIRGDAGPR
ncbi:hypothetical protein [Amycolatopsis sp. FDAARGOS 1241]|uniref:hypothetical protein n=1 Tax=Amycolatopsis sp. FDAARGOS 1241 TaxID=2778070 RepID=UPI00194ECAA3|nr:hypothetical protein [Amycolatopsis sp. FDAARGOS 1241]QRP50174.1 hypothetical protein I6J71_22195 [Amycolatopsis sp. FDAARGOS 1241]